MEEVGGGRRLRGGKNRCGNRGRNADFLVWREEGTVLGERLIETALRGKVLLRKRKLGGGYHPPLLRFRLTQPLVLLVFLGAKVTHI
jgi:hypothetical protein